MGKVIDIAFEGIDFSKMMYIMSDKYQEISDQIQKEIERGTTGLHSRGMYTNKESMLLLCVVTRNEIAPIKKIIANIDSTAFIVISNAREVFGQGFKGEE